MKQKFRILLILFFLLINLKLIMAKEYSKRIISLSPSTTELLYSLNLEKNIIAVSNNCNYPPAAIKKIKIGDFNLNFEKIIELKPDLIVAEGTILKEALEKFKKLKIPILILNSKNLSNFEKSFLMLSKAAGKETLGKKLLKNFNLQLKKIKNKTKEIKNKPKIFLEIWNKPLQTCSKGTLTDELINLAGGINIAQDLKIPYPVISEEFLITQNPQIIILTTSKINEIYQKKSWKNILALKNKKVYYLNPDLIARPTLRLILALNKLTSFFNPQIKL